MANLVIANTKMAKALAPAIVTHGIDVQVYTLAKVETIPCPCTDNPWKRYSSIWHTQNPTMEDCLGTGELNKSGKQIPITIDTIHAIVMPHWAYVGEMFAWITAGKVHDWSWWAITQDITKFNRLKFTTDQNETYIFKVLNTMPFVIENCMTPTVTAYHLMPLDIEQSFK